MPRFLRPRSRRECNSRPRATRNPPGYSRRADVVPKIGELSEPIKSARYLIRVVRAGPFKSGKRRGTLRLDPHHTSISELRWASARNVPVVRSERSAAQARRHPRTSPPFARSFISSSTADAPAGACGGSVVKSVLGWRAAATWSASRTRWTVCLLVTSTVRSTGSSLAIGRPRSTIERVIHRSHQGLKLFLASAMLSLLIAKGIFDPSENRYMRLATV